MTYRETYGYDKLCIYCQESFDDPLDLAHHIVVEHKNTYAYDSIKEITGYALEEAST